MQTHKVEYFTSASGSTVAEIILVTEVRVGATNTDSVGLAFVAATPLAACFFAVGAIA